MTDTYPDAWGAGDRVLVAISDNEGSTWVALEPIVSSIKWTPGKKGIEQIATVDTGRIEKNIPQELCSLEFDAYWSGISKTTAKTNVSPVHFFNSDKAASTSTYVTASQSRDRFCVAVLFTTDTDSNLTANSGTSSTSCSYRIILNRARLTEITYSYDDHIGKGSFKFEMCPFTKSKLPNYVEEDCGDTASALDELTTTLISTYFASVHPTA